MIYIYPAILILLAIGFTGFIISTIKKNAPTLDPQSVKNLEIAKEELTVKHRITQELKAAAASLVPPEKVAEIRQQAEAIEEQVRAESGKITITEAEIEALDVRMRELNELKRELEISSLDAAREIDLLREQEESLAKQNSTLKEELSSTYSKLDSLLGTLANSAEAVERLTKAKTELVSAESKIAFYQQTTTEINAEYVKLKRAYDALDIEYAQLYEKQQSKNLG